MIFASILPPKLRSKRWSFLQVFFKMGPRGSQEVPRGLQQRILRDFGVHFGKFKVAYLGFSYVSSCDVFYAFQSFTLFSWFFGMGSFCDVFLIFRGGKLLRCCRDRVPFPSSPQRYKVESYALLSLQIHFEIVEFEMDEWQVDFKMNEFQMDVGRVTRMASACRGRVIFSASP